MSDEPRTPADIVRVTTDDLLLDALGRGERPRDGDEVAAMLAAWRSELGAEHDEPGVAVVAPVPTRKVRRLSRIAVAAAAALVAGGGLTVAAASGANPDSPLWPIARVVFPERADVAAAEHAIDEAREAAAQGRLGDASRLADEAESLIGKVRSPHDAQRLRAELDEVRRMIAGAPANPPGVGTATPAPGVTPAPGPSATGGTGPGGAPGGGAGTPGLPLPTLPGGGGLPSLPLPTTPSLPLPTLPLPQR